MLMKTALYAGALGGAAALLAGSALARREGGRGWTPVNAAAHVLWKDEAAVDFPEPALTGTGLTINAMAATFWGGILAARLETHPPETATDVYREAALVAAAAALLDYGILPRRLSPGWELGLSGRSIALVFGAMALGLGTGAALARPTEPPGMYDSARKRVSGADPRSRPSLQ